LFLVTTVGPGLCLDVLSHLGGPPSLSQRGACGGIAVAGATNCAASRSIVRKLYEGWLSDDLRIVLKDDW
jgi:hypothetical protein